MENRHYPFTPINLPYHFGSLEPYIDERTMRVHYTGHYFTYLHKLNAALEKYPELQEKPLPWLLQNARGQPEEIRTAVLRNGGGVLNHELYFNGMTNQLNTGVPSGKLGAALAEHFPSPQGFAQAMAEAADAVFGSGYLYLVTDPRGHLSFAHTANQDTLLGTPLSPIITLDLWEHAYYLKHLNKRPDYIQDFLHVINWPYAGLLYERVLQPAPQPQPNEPVPQQPPQPKNTFHAPAKPGAAPFRRGPQQQFQRRGPNGGWQ